MNKYVFGFIVPLMGVLCWIVTNSIAITAIIIALYGFFFVIMLPRHIKKFEQMQQRKHEMFDFINGLIIALSVKQTLAPALESIEGQLSTDLKARIASYETIDSFQIINELNHYFISPTYEMFLTIIELQATQGGSILKMSQPLLASLRRQTTDFQEKLRISKRKLVNFIILWVLTLTVLLFSRYGINYLYEQMMTSLIFQFGIAAYFIYMLFSIYVWCSRFFKVNINE